MMKEEGLMKYAGDLIEEEKEIEKIIEQKSVCEEAESITVGCQTFLTIFCCQVYKNFIDQD